MEPRIKGYAGKQARVLLGQQTVKIETLDPAVLRKYLGGVGYAARILYDELDEGVEPLGPDNKLVVATGPLSLNRVPGGGSVELCFKSPSGNAWGEARCGGDFGPNLKKAGYDFLIIEGRAKDPVYIYIEDGEIGFRPAGHLCADRVSQKTRKICEELDDPDVSVLTIGPAGENLVKFATVMCNDRAAGRCGAGSVLGSKNLLGIAVKGSGSILPADRKKFMGALKDAFKIINANENTAAFKADGTMGDYVGNSDAGDFPTKNWQSNSWDKAEKIYEHYRKNNLVKGAACYKGCPVRCGRMAEVKKGPYQTPLHGGAEYESIAAFTAFVLNQDADCAIKSTYLCNEYGIDTISTGAVIGFAMECYENGLIQEHDPENLDLRWGNARILPQLVGKIAKREGVGALLAEGVKGAADRIQKNADAFAVHCKGLEGAAHDPRSGKALAVSYGTANRGMCHIHPCEAMAWDSGKMDFGLMRHGLKDPETVDRWDEKGKGESIRLLQDGCTSPDILGTCKFMMYVGLSLGQWADMLSGLTGWDIHPEELLTTCERTINLQRLFNLKAGLRREDDLLPFRPISQPLFGAYQNQPRCHIKDYEGMLKEYYQARKWTEQGVPELELVQRLDIDTPPVTRLLEKLTSA